MAFVLHHDNLAQAYHILGIRHKVTLRMKDDWWWGGYGPPAHTIEFSTSVPKDEVSHVLWHELGHAYQCERDFDGDYRAYDTATSHQYNAIYKRIPTDDKEYDEWEYDEWLEQYYTIPLEREAEDIAIKYAKVHPLVRL